MDKIITKRKSGKHTSNQPDPNDNNPTSITESGNFNNAEDEFYIKYEGKSYRKCAWISRQRLLKIGKSKLIHYEAKCQKEGDFPEDPNDILSEAFQVIHKIVGMRFENSVLKKKKNSTNCVKISIAYQNNQLETSRNKKKNKISK